MKKALALVLPASVLGVVLGVLAVGKFQWMSLGYGVFVPSVAVAVVLLVTAIAALLLGALRWLWPLCIGLVTQLFGLLLLYQESWGFSTPWKPVWWTLAAIGAVLLVMGAIWLAVTVRTRWFERKMLQGVGDAGAEELEAIRKNFQDALGKLRRAGHGRNAIYELPWFLVIGRPQGGKTTAIKNSGLGLPVRKDWVKGVGGTVNVDFFFTNDLIFMDTPGRWVTDGANEREQRQWTELLRLLRRFRGHRPVDGLVVAVPVDDLLSLSEDALRDQASRVREILDRLHGELRFRFPVYLIVTKCDLVDGFVEFFQGLPVQRRHEILGWSNPDPNRGSAARLLGVALPRMLRRLEAYRLEMLARIASSTRARKLFFFPEEFRRLVSPLGVYADELFHRDSYRETPVFRGLYFTSGTQGEGSPLGQALADFARNLGVRVPPAAPQEEEEQKRSYFLLQLFRDLMVQDEGLVGRTAGQWWARRRNTLFGAVLPAAVSICFVSLAGVSFALNRGTWERAKKEVPAIVGTLKDAKLTYPEVLNRTEQLRELHNDVMGSILRSFGMRQGGDLRKYTFNAFQASFKGRLLAPTLQAGQDLLQSRGNDCANKIDLLHAVLWLRSGSRIDLGDTAAFEQLWRIDSEEERDLLGRQFRHLLRYSSEVERRDLLPDFNLEAAAQGVRDTCSDAGARSTLERYLELERRCQQAVSSDEVESCYTDLISVLRETPEDYARRQARLTNLKTDMKALAEEGQAGASEAAEILQAIRLPDRVAKACVTEFDAKYRPGFLEYVNRQDLINACRAQVKGVRSAVDREKGFAAIWKDNTEDLRTREAKLKEDVNTFERTCRTADINFENGFNFPVLRDATKGGIRVICVEPPPTPEDVVDKAKLSRKRSEEGAGRPALTQLRYLEHLAIPADYRAEGWQRKRKEWSQQLELKDNYSHAQYLDLTRKIENSVEAFAQQYVEFWRRYLRGVRLLPRPDTVSVPDWVQALATTQEYRQVVDYSVSALTTIHETEPPFNAMEARVAGFTQLAQYQGDISEYQQSLQQVAQDLRQISSSDREWRKYKKDLASKPLGIALARVGGYGGSDRLPVSVFKEPLLEAKAFVDGKESTSQDWPDLVKLAKRVGDGYPLSLDGDPVPEDDLVRLSGLVRRLKDSDEAEPASDAAVWLSRANDVSTLLFDEDDAPRKLRVQWVKESETFDKPDLAEQIEVRKIHLKLGEGLDWDAEPGKKDNKTFHVPLTGEDAPKDSELSVTLGIRKKFGKVLPGSNWKEQTPIKPVSGTGAPWKLVVQGLQPAGLEGYAGGTPQLEYAFLIKDGEKQLGLLKIRFRLEGEDVPRFLTLLKDGLPPPPATLF